jgi:hypothetical protein
MSSPVSSTDIRTNSEDSLRHGTPSDNKHKDPRETLEIWLGETLLRTFNSLHHQSDKSNANPNTFFQRPSAGRRDLFTGCLKTAMTRVKCHPIIYVVAVYYLCEYLESEKTPLSETEFLLYFSVCISLASKMHEDRFLGNSFYHMWFDFEKAGISLKEFSAVEREVLRGLNYDIFISYEVLKAYITKNKLHM